MTIAQRLVALMAASIACLFLLSGVSYYQMNKVFTQANYGNEITAPRLFKLNEAIISFFQIQTRTFIHVLTRGPKGKIESDEKLSDDLIKLDQDLKDYETS